MQRSELKVLETKLNHGWQIPDDLLDATVERMRDIITNGSNREATAAARVIQAIQKSRTPSSLHLHQHGSPAATEGLTLEQRKENLKARIQRLRRMGRRTTGESS